MTPSSLLNVTRLPARLSPEQVAELLGVRPHDIPVLVRARILTPLGRPKQNSVKWFAASDVEALCRDTKAMNRAQLEIQRHWEKHNHAEAA